ncbi:hypothetical protein CVT24_001244 [Panaeolus cyanescens]|uniref:Fungal-type protein kinase domain-containing protein n=1 Tax=Panaeolus cyanescens TaxID=181874 RepID=A0A409YFV6_9AGAR|nr:hypothetical protein CVT24_001244 [Panaeolus cyanescens]
MELRPDRVLTNEELDQLLASVATEEQVLTYLNNPNSPYSESDGWTFLSQVLDSREENIRGEAELYDPLVAFFNDVLQHFASRDTTTRTIIKTRSDQSQISNGLNASSSGSQTNWNQVKRALKSFPGLCAVVQGGRHFPTTVQDDNKSGHRNLETGPTYEICGSPIEVTRDDIHDDDVHLRTQCAIYARKCFLHQMGRRFVFVPLLTEKRIRLYRFDHGGALVSPWVDYHENPAVLVRMILLACALPEVELGANPAIIWEGDERYIVIDDLGITPIENSDAVQPVRRRFKVTEAMELSRGICGRGTCIWRVLDEDGKECIVKYMWRAVGRTPEWQLLLKLRDLKGVAQILGRSEECSMYSIRGFTPHTPFPNPDRIACFLVLESYGSPLTGFKSPLHFLQGFHDAIEGHRNMWEVGVLHRDISINNILFGKDGNRVPSHGVVIDLDLGVFFNRTDSLAEVDCLTGTHLFQSIHVLKSALSQNPTQHPILHDYIDDLQSFFWVFCWVTMGNEVTDDGTRKPIPQSSPQLSFFDKDNQTAYELKHYRLLQPDNLPIHPSWPATFNTLKNRMVAFLLHYYHVKEAQSRINMTRGSLTIPSQFHYNTFLGYIKDAIQSFNPGIPPTPISADLDFVAYDKMIAEKQALAEASAPPTARPSNGMPSTSAARTSISADTSPLLPVTSSHRPLTPSSDKGDIRTKPKRPRILTSNSNS